MDLRWLQTFLVVAEEGHLRRAAVRLSMSPASVSRQLRQLERELRTTLFVRRPRLRLTPAGRIMAIRGQVFLDTWAVTAAELREAHSGRRRTLVLGLDDFGAGPLNLPIVRALRASAAPHHLEVRQLPDQNQFSALATGEVDLVLGGFLEFDASLEVTVLATQPRGVFLGADSDIAHSRSLSSTDLLGLPFTRYRPGMPPVWTAYWHLHEQRGGPPVLTETTVTDHVSLLTAVALDGAIGPSNAILAQHLTAPEIAFRPLADLPPAPISLAVRRDRADDLLRRLTIAAQQLAHTTLSALGHPFLTPPPRSPSTTQ